MRGKTCSPHRIKIGMVLENKDKNKRVLAVVGDVAPFWSAAQWKLCVCKRSAKPPPKNNDHRRSRPCITYIRDQSAGRHDSGVQLGHKNGPLGLGGFTVPRYPCRVPERPPPLQIKAEGGLAMTHHQAGIHARVKHEESGHVLAVPGA